MNNGTGKDVNRDVSIFLYAIKNVAVMEEQKMSQVCKE